MADRAVPAPHDRFARWNRPAAETFKPPAPRPGARAPLHGRVEEFKLGSVKLLRLSPDGSHIPRDVALIRKQAPEHLQVMLPIAGRHTVTREGRSTRVVKADIVAWSSTSPYPIDVRAVRCGIILACPLAMLGPQASRASRHTVLRFDSTTGPGLVLRECLLALEAALEQDTLTGCEQSMGEAAIDLVRALYIRSSDRLAPPAAALRRQVLDYIDEHLGEPGLNTASVARAMFVSRSHLWRAFQAEGTTITQWIRHRRLERCRRDLLDPSLAHESIFAIAARWGFVSQAHFSRIFRSAYGCSPRQMRHQAA